MPYSLVRVEEKSVLKDYREELGLTQQQVADKARIQLRQYQRFESGERNLSSSSFSIACRVIEALGMDVSQYYHGAYVIGDDVIFSKDGLRKAADGSLLDTPKPQQADNQ